jgi:hypothetical protein
MPDKSYQELIITNFGLSPSGYTGSQGTAPTVSRTTATVSTGVIANSITANVDMSGFKGYALYKIQTSAASWVRVYINSASRTADAGRLDNVDPSANSGVISEVITSGNSFIVISPASIGFNAETIPTTTIPVAITNKSGTSANITVTLTIVKLED